MSRRDLAQLGFVPPAGAGFGGKGGAGAKGGGVEAPDTLKSEQMARVIDLLSEGPIEAIHQVYLDGTKLLKSDGTFNFKNVSYTYRLGYRDQARPPPKYKDVGSEVPVNIRVKYGTANAVSQTITANDADQVRITVSVPALYLANKATGDVIGYHVGFNLDVSVGAGWQRIATDLQIDGKTMSRYQRSYVFSLPPGGPPWQVRIVRSTPDSTDEQKQNELWWDSFTVMTHTENMYSYSSYAAFRINAEQFSNIPRRTYDVSGVRIQVPTNYDPVSRVYSGVWDGSFKVAWTNNPAWIFYNLLTDDRYGVGEFVKPADVDKWSLYEIGRWCDEWVSNGKGGWEPRFTCNVVLVNQREAFDVLQDIAAVFRGFVYYTGGLMVPVADKPTDPSGIFTNANVIDGVFNYQGTDYRARHTVVTVPWNDPKSLGQPQIAWVEDPDGVRRYGIQPMALTGFGCTSQSQAIRAGRWALYTEQQETEVVTFRAGLEGAFVKPGDIIKVMDSNVSGDRHGGRVTYSEAFEVVAGTWWERIHLDAPLTILPSSAGLYQITVVCLDGVMRTSTVYQDPGLAQTETLFVYTLAFPARVQPGSPFVVVYPGLEAQLFRVITVTEGDDQTVEITGLEHNPGKWAWVENNIPIQEPDVTNLVTMPDAVTNLQAKDWLRATSSISVAVGVTVSWTSIAPSFDVDSRPASGNWQTARTMATALDIFPVAEGWWEFRVTPISALGRRGPSTTISYYVVGRFAPPSGPQDFRVHVVDGVALFQWRPAPEIDVIIGGHFELRHSPRETEATWETSTVVIPAIPGAASSAETPYMRGTWFLRTFDIVNIQSAEYAAIITYQTDDRFVAWETICENPDFLGHHVNTEVRLPQQWLVIGTTGGLWDDELTAIDTWATVDVLPEGESGPGPSAGTYYFEEYIDLGGVFPTRLVADILAFPFSENDVSVDDRLTNVDDWTDWDNAISDEGGTVTVWMRRTDNDPALVTAVWSNWEILTAGERVGRGFQFKAELAAPPGQNIAVETLCITADLRRKIDEGSDVPVTAAQTYHVTFGIKFYLPPAVVVTIQNAVAGDRAVVFNKTREGFDIDIRNQAGAFVFPRSFDWHAQGY